LQQKSYIHNKYNIQNMRVYDFSKKLLQLIFVSRLRDRLLDRWEFIWIEALIAFQLFIDAQKNIFAAKKIFAPKKIFATKKTFSRKKKHFRAKTADVMYWLLAAGLPDFYCYNLQKNIPNDHKIYQMTTKYTKWR
jgi:hypothetical protein